MERGDQIRQWCSQIDDLHVDMDTTTHFDKTGTDTNGTLNINSFLNLSCIAVGGGVFKCPLPHPIPHFLFVSDVNVMLMSIIALSVNHG